LPITAADAEAPWQHRCHMSAWSTPTGDVSLSTSLLAGARRSTGTGHHPHETQQPYLRGTIPSLSWSGRETRLSFVY